jgi:methylmalonyl-CoA/ethylmalonyl-CoA epimerase
MQGEGSTRIELLEPITEGSPIDKFLASKGPGVQQIAVNVSDIESKIEELSAMGFRMINEEPVTGSSGHRVAFIHPSSCGGVLVELVEFPQSES